VNHGKKDRPNPRRIQPLCCGHSKQAYKRLFHHEPGGFLEPIGGQGCLNSQEAAKAKARHGNLLSTGLNTALREKGNAGAKAVRASLNQTQGLKSKSGVTVVEAKQEELK